MLTITRESPCKRSKGLAQPKNLKINKNLKKNSASVHTNAVVFTHRKETPLNLSKTCKFYYAARGQEQTDHKTGNATVSHNQGKKYGPIGQLGIPLQITTN